ncbi:MAG TPA: AI-2E family transporter [Anaerolineae bacterium]|nr:AI-2E family transporter [Anaerolineae bacterium]
MSGPRRGADIFDAERDRRIRSAGIRAWSIVGVLVLAVMIYTGLSAISGFVLPLIVAIVLGMVFEPVARLLSRVIPRQAASLLVLVGIGVLAVVAIAVVVIGVIDQGPEIVDQTQAAIDLGRNWLAERGVSVIVVDDVRAQLSTFIDDVLPGLLSYVPSAFSGISSFLVSTFIALFILYFVLAEWDSLATWVGAHLGVPANLGAGIVADATRSFRDYFYVLTLSSLPVAIIVGVTAALLGVPLAFTIGLITFVTSYVPYLGALVSSVFALLIAFGSGGLVPALIMLIVILVAQNVVQPILQRQLERNALDLHPIVSFGSTIIGSVLVGVLGATLSAPAVAMVLRVRNRVSAFQAGELDEAEISAIAAEAELQSRDPDSSAALGR